MTDTTKVSLPVSLFGHDGPTSCVDCRRVIPDDTLPEDRVYVFEGGCAVGEACPVCTNGRARSRVVEVPGCAKLKSELPASRGTLRRFARPRYYRHGGLEQ